MKVIMLETIEGKQFSFVKGQVYNAGAKELRGKILVRQPNSPKKKDWWCTFDKSCVDKKFIIVCGRMEEVK